MASIVQTASALARAMARAQLPEEARKLLTLQVAWTLAYILAEWRAGRDLNAAGLPQFAMAFSFFRAPLERFITKAESAQDAAAFAGAGSYFASAVNDIGLDRLQDALETSVFRQAQQSIVRQVPPPAEVVQAFGGAVQPRAEQSEQPSRIRQYAAADYQTRQNPAQLADIAFYRAQLFRVNLSPEERWFAEQQLVGRGEVPYQSPADARAVWEAALRSPMHGDLRRYFASNLAELDGKSVKA